MNFNESDIETITTDWQGIALSVSYEADWSTDQHCVYAHLQVLSITREPLPITETGYRSHFLHPDYVEAAGGPVAFVHAWLDHHAKKKGWRKQAEAARQMTLF